MDIVKRKDRVTNTRSEEIQETRVHENLVGPYLDYFHYLFGERICWRMCCVQMHTLLLPSRFRLGLPTTFYHGANMAVSVSSQFGLTGIDTGYRKSRSRFGMTTWTITLTHVCLDLDFFFFFVYPINNNWCCLFRLVWINS